MNLIATVCAWTPLLKTLPIELPKRRLMPLKRLDEESRLYIRYAGWKLCADRLEAMLQRYGTELAKFSRKQYTQFWYLYRRMISQGYQYVHTVVMYGEAVWDEEDNSGTYANQYPLGGIKFSQLPQKAPQLTREKDATWDTWASQFAVDRRLKELAAEAALAKVVEGDDYDETLYTALPRTIEEWRHLALRPWFGLVDAMSESVRPWLRELYDELYWTFYRKPVTEPVAPLEEDDWEYEGIGLDDDLYNEGEL